MRRALTSGMETEVVRKALRSVKDLYSSRVYIALVRVTKSMEKMAYVLEDLLQISR